MVTTTRPVRELAAAYPLESLQHKIQDAKLAIDEELGRATDMGFRLKLVITANSLRNLEEQILRRS
jgi:hypothetical protein